MTIKTLNQTGFIFNSYDNSIEEITYKEYLREYGADETTSPRGVEPRIHVREITGDIYQHIETKEQITGDQYDELDEDEQDNYSHLGEATTAWELWSWGVRGNNPYKIDSYDIEEDAELEMYDYFEYYVREKNWDAPTFYSTKEELMQQWADLAQKPVEVVERYVRIKEAAETRNAAIKKELEEKEREFRAKHNAAIEAEAALINPDETFIAEIKSVCGGNVSGNDKSDALSTAFVGLLNRSGRAKIHSDFWKVFRIVSKKAMTEVKPTHKVISRLTGLVEFEGSYFDCQKYFTKVGFDLSILRIDDPIWDEDGNSNAIESN